MRMVLTAVLIAIAFPAAAHGPVFSPGPETTWKGAREVTLGVGHDRAGAGRDDALSIETRYGMSADWEIELEVPFARRRDDGRRATGIGDVVLGTKVQLYKRDFPGAQFKVSSLGKLSLPSGAEDDRPRLGPGTPGLLAGVAAGYESRRWYGFGSLTTRLGFGDADGFAPGDRQSANLVAGMRPVLTPYDAPDTVVMLELNWQRARPDRLFGAPQPDTGGWELFVSPVVWWTYRQVAVRGGVQIPVADNLNGDGARSDYRLRAEFVYHF